MNDTARRSGIIVVASDVLYWMTSEKELVEWLNILAKLSNKFKEAAHQSEFHLLFTLLRSEPASRITKRRYFDSKCTASTTRHDLAFVQCLMCFSRGASDDVSLPPRAIAVNSINLGSAFLTFARRYTRGTKKPTSSRRLSWLLRRRTRREVDSLCSTLSEGRTARTSFEEHEYRSWRSLRNVIL